MQSKVKQWHVNAFNSSAWYCTAMALRRFAERGKGVEYPSLDERDKGKSQRCTEWNCKGKATQVTVLRRKGSELN